MLNRKVVFSSILKLNSTAINYDTYIPMCQYGTCKNTSIIIISSGDVLFFHFEKMAATLLISELGGVLVTYRRVQHTVIEASDELRRALVTYRRVQHSVIEASNDLKRVLVTYRRVQHSVIEASDELRRVLVTYRRVQHSVIEASDELRRVLVTYRRVQHHSTYP